MNVRFRSCLLFSLALLACAGPDAPGGEDAAPAPAAAAGEEASMPGMAGMNGGGPAEEMQAHLRSMEGAGGDSLKAMLAVHRQMSANTIARMNREMRDMNMSGDAAWNATVDSLRQDLVRMPEMGDDELHTFMPLHVARMNRLMEMHRTMMGSMKM